MTTVAAQALQKLRWKT